MFPTQWISDHFSDIRLANVSAVSLQKNCIFRCYCIADTDSGQTKSYLDVVDHCCWLVHVSLLRCIRGSLSVVDAGGGVAQGDMGDDFVMC